ncbi:MAG: glycosyltransferase family 4 protein [Kiritimatiellia bacterium]
MNFWINNPFDHLPGEGRRVQRYGLLCRALVKAGHHVVWWSSDFNHALKRPRRLENIYLAPEGYQVRLVPTMPYTDNVSLRRAWSHRRYAHSWYKMAVEAVESGELEPPDLVLTSWPPCGIATTARRFRTLWDCKAVVDVMDAWPESFYRLLPLPRQMREWFGSLVFWRLHRIARKAFCEADAVTAVGRTYLNLAARYGCKAPRHLCYHGITRMSNGANRYALDEREPLRLIYVGSMGRSYDLLTVVRGVKKLAEAGEAVRLDFAGTGPKEEMLRQEAQGCHAIRFYGYLSNEDMQQLLSDSDVAIIPMFPDSYVAVPYKLADYTAAGLPIICCLTGETQSFIERYGAGSMYTAGHVQSFIEVVKRYTRQRNRLTQESLASARIARENFMMDAIYPEFVHFLSDLCGH